jgi:lipopolysaccharide/colanic/teichoic acid biosynthesis glycosyltransferase
LDELPQLFNVLLGEMSFVGPRPVTSSEIPQIYGPDAEEILSVKPGLSGLWQISGRNRLSNSERRRFDLQCVRTRSARMYLRILTRTLPEVFTGENTW